ncbi:MAG TPA: Rv3235 family protein, partial [Sporichthyaceae bacterium]|nr:Rv3235 family protein [Sporichthyaceae bacterium]
PPVHRLPDPALPDPHAWATAFAYAVAETLTGHRPPGVLATFVSPPVREVLHRRPVPGQRRPTTRARPPQPHRVHVQWVAYDAVEANTVLLGQGTARAIAFRMQIRRGRWTCTALEIG